MGYAPGQRWNGCLPSVGPRQGVRALISRSPVSRSGDGPGVVGRLAGGHGAAVGEGALRVAEPGDGREAGAAAGGGPEGRPVPVSTAERGRRVLGPRRATAPGAVGGGFAA